MRLRDLQRGESRGVWYATKQRDRNLGTLQGVQVGLLPQALASCPPPPPLVDVQLANRALQFYDGCTSNIHVRVLFHSAAWIVYTGAGGPHNSTHSPLPRSL